MTQNHGVIYKAISGFYYVKCDEPELIECRARGKFRKEKINPLVGDEVVFTKTGGSSGVLEEILPRRNTFIRPPVANIDLMIIMACAVNPITDPFLIDRVTAVADRNNCDCVICVNKCDLDSGDKLFEIYKKAGFTTIRTSSVTGDGVEELGAATRGKICSFVGNSGAGKSSLLNALAPGFKIPTAKVSEKLGRGRHTTRHVELYPLSNGALVADTPGFSSFNTERMELIKKDELQYSFREFGPFLGKCRFNDCAHINEKGCGVLDALKRGDIGASRYESYVRLYNSAKQIKEWEIKRNS